MQETSKQGLAFKYMVTCQDTFNCRWTCTFFNSPMTKQNNSQFTRSFDVNPRAIYCMRRLAKGYAGFKKFCYLMNHPPMSEKSFRVTNVNIFEAVKVVAQKSLNDAAEEVKIIDGVQDDGYCHTSISVDGTLQRRGFSSMTNGKVLDATSMSRHCQGCVNINALQNGHNTSHDEVMKLKAEHDCSITHLGSAPVMETKGAEKIFNRSKDNGLIYSGYYGNGDSKAYEYQ